MKFLALTLNNKKNIKITFLNHYKLTPPMADQTQHHHLFGHHNEEERKHHKHLEELEELAAAAAGAYALVKF